MIATLRIKEWVSSSYTRAAALVAMVVVVVMGVVGNKCEMDTNVV